MIRILNWLSAAVIVLWLMPSMCLERIDPGHIGVRRSLEGGVAKADFGVGYHLSIPFWHSWYQLDGTLHYLEFAQKSGSSPLEVRTKENNIIFIDLTVPYRIIPGSAYEIVREGLATSYEEKVKSSTVGILREQLANLSTIDVQVPEKRREATLRALPILNKVLAQYHVEATHVVLRSLRFREQYEQKLQNKQLFAVQGRLDEAMQRESAAKQETDTFEKGISKEIALKEEEWNRKIEELRSKYEVEIAQIDAEATQYERNKRAEADAFFTEAEAIGNLAEARAEALGERLRSQALATKAGRTFSAIEAVQRFKLGDIQLNSTNPDFLYHFGSMQAWRRFFLGE